MIRPNNLLKEVWDFIIFLMALGLSVEIPLRLSLWNPTPGFFLTLEIVVTIIFAIDMILEFNTGYYYKHRLIADTSKIRSRYLKTFFGLDLIAAIPWTLFLTLSSGIYFHFFRIFRIFRSYRTLTSTRVKSLNTKWQEALSVSPMITRLGAFMFLLMITAHWVACGWIKLGGIPSGLDPLSTYIQGYYWTITTLTTVGYGDITPTGNAQYIFTMVVEIMGVGVYGFVIGNIASLFEQMDATRAEHKKRLSKIKTFMNYKKIPLELKYRVEQYYNQLWEGKMGMDENEILDALPSYLKTEISLFLNKDIMEKVPFLKGAEESFLRGLISVLKPMLAMPGDYIIRKGDVADKMFFINEGNLKVLKGEEREVVAQLSAGQFFGEMSLIEQKGRNADIIAESYSELYELNKDDFDKVLKKYPKFKEHVYDTVIKRKSEGSSKK